eukprot:627587-Prymnesium_polylepis.1
MGASLLPSSSSTRAWPTWLGVAPRVAPRALHNPPRRNGAADTFEQDDLRRDNCLKCSHWMWARVTKLRCVR